MPVRSDSGIFASVGVPTAQVRSATTSVSDGRLDIEFLHQFEDPIVSAIETFSTSQ